MKKIVVDTDILINYSHGFNKQFLNLLEEQDDNKVKLYLNPIIIAEFLNDKKLINNKNIVNAHELLNIFSLVNINKETGVIVGELLRNNKIPFLADAFIAASCLQFNLELYTDNKKHFEHIKRLKLFSF